MQARPTTALGFQLKAMGRLDEAIDSYQQAVRLDPTYAVAHCNLGHALYEKGRLDEAINSVQQALNIDPQLAARISTLAPPCIRKGRLDEAIDRFQRVSTSIRSTPWPTTTGASPFASRAGSRKPLTTCSEPSGSTPN